MSDEIFTIEGTKFTYEEWAEATVGDFVYRLWQIAGRKDEDCTIEIVRMIAKKEGFEAVVKSTLNKERNVLFEVRYDRETERTTVITYHPVDVFVRKPDPRFKIRRP